MLFSHGAFLSGGVISVLKRFYLAVIQIQRFYGFAASSPKGSTIDALALNAWSRAAKVAVTIMDNIGLCADGLSRGLKNIDKY